MDLFEEIVKLPRAGHRGALATIVHTNGSIPSYESSRMLVREDGSIAGTIGGGCVEADVWAAARHLAGAAFHVLRGKQMYRDPSLGRGRT